MTDQIISTSLDEMNSIIEENTLSSSTTTMTTKRTNINTTETSIDDYGKIQSILHGYPFGVSRMERKASMGYAMDKQ